MLDDKLVKVKGLETKVLDLCKVAEILSEIVRSELIE